MFGLIGVAAAFGTFVGAVSGAQGAVPAVSLWDGVYTEEQAKRGKDRFMDSCIGCHSADLLSDGQANDRAGSDFMFVWGNRSVFDLFTRIRTTMPQDSPGSLSGDAYIDIIAFLLQSNHFPAGTKELERNAEVLKNLIIAKKNP